MLVMQEVMTDPARGVDGTELPLISVLPLPFLLFSLNTTEEPY